MRLFSFGIPAMAAEAADDLTILRLVRSRRVGAATFHRLLAEYGSASAALAALPGIAAKAGVRDYQICPEGVAAAELAAGHKTGAVLLRHDDPAYPAALRDLDDAPPVLWIKGSLDCLARPAIAVIGARNASSLGLRMAHGMAGALASAGVTVTAGLARGIDTAAHEASCAAGTVAVLAGGIGRIYPSENAPLADAIVAQGGALVSEQAPMTEPAARLFPLRNRIVSGLARAVVVVEAAHRSGTLITAKCALDQGRDVMAVPGHPMDARAAGCNALIRDGALLVRSAEDVLAAIGLDAAKTVVPPPMASSLTNSDSRTGLQRVAETLRRPAARIPSRSSQRDDGGPVAVEARVLSLLGRAPIEEAALLRDLGLTAAALAPTLLTLELDGHIVRAPGGMISLG